MMHEKGLPKKCWVEAVDTKGSSRENST